METPKADSAEKEIDDVIRDMFPSDFLQKTSLTFEDRELIRKTQDNLERGLRIASGILTEEEIALVLKRAYDKDKLRMIENFL